MLKWILWSLGFGDSPVEIISISLSWKNAPLFLYNESLKSGIVYVYKLTKNLAKLVFHFSMYFMYFNVFA